MDLKNFFQYFVGEHAINFARGKEISGRIPYNAVSEYAKKDDCGSAFWYLVTLEGDQKWWVPSKKLAITEQGRLLMDAFDEKHHLEIHRTVIVFDEETVADDSQKTISYSEGEISSQVTQPFPEEGPSAAFIDWGNVEFSPEELLQDAQRSEPDSEEGPSPAFLDWGDVELSPEELLQDAQRSEPDSEEIEGLYCQEEEQSTQIVEAQPSEGIERPYHQEEEQNTQIVEAQPSEVSSSEDFFLDGGLKRGRVTAVEILEQDWFREREEKRRKLQIGKPTSVVLVPASPEREQKSDDESSDGDEIIPATQNENAMRPDEDLLTWWKRVGDRRGI